MENEFYTESDKKQEWYIKLMHERALVDAQIKVLGKEFVCYPKGGVHNPKGLFKKWRGELFHEHLSALGHSSFELKTCKCNIYNNHRFIVGIK